jgi:hypothetical protein
LGDLTTEEAETRRDRFSALRRWGFEAAANLRASSASTGRRHVLVSPAMPTPVRRVYDNVRAGQMVFRDVSRKFKRIGFRQSGILNSNLQL